MNDDGTVRVDVLVHVMKIMDERHGLYTEKFAAAKEAVKDALAAQDKLTAAAFLSAEKAITKAEDAQREYNVRSNEFRGQLDDQAKMLMPRSEAMTMINNVQKQFQELKEGPLAALNTFKDNSQGKMAVIVGIASLLSGVVSAAVAMVIKGFATN
jgi:hypothetical protein